MSTAMNEETCIKNRVGLEIKNLSIQNSKHHPLLETKEEE